MKKLLIVTTVPSTLRYILSGQPKFLSGFYDVAAVSTPGRDLKIVEDSEGVRTYGIAMTRGISPLSDLISLFKMIVLFCKIRPDAVHSYTPKAGLICALAGLITFVPARIHTFTGLIFPTARGVKKRVLSLLDALVCRLNTIVIAEGEGVKKQLQSITKAQIEIISHGNIAGVDLEYFDPDRFSVVETVTEFKAKLGIDRSFVFCFVGRLNTDKGVTELVTAFIELSQHYDVKLILLGEIEKVNPVAQSTLDLIKSHPSIYHLGFLEDIRVPLLSCDVFVLPSYREGFPNSVIQACAMLKPCLVTDVPGSNEIIIPEANGWIVPAKSSSALLQAMVEIVNTPSIKIKKMGTVARDIISAKFERRAYLKKLLGFYQEHVK